MRSARLNASAKKAAGGPSGAASHSAAGAERTAAASASTAAPSASSRPGRNRPARSVTMPARICSSPTASIAGSRAAGWGATPPEASASKPNPSQRAAKIGRLRAVWVTVNSAKRQPGGTGSGSSAASGVRTLNVSRRAEASPAPTSAKASAKPTAVRSAG